MVEKLHWLGHSSFRFDGSKIIYFDPWKLLAGAKKADIICVSHGHFDHFSKDDIAIISSKETVIVTTAAVARQLKGAKLSCKEVKALSPGETFDAGSVSIKAVASYNTNKDFHPKKSNNVGFIVTVDGISIYHAGDTDDIPEMEGCRCDIALLPVSGTYVMTADEAAHAALAIRPKSAIPMHYGEVAGSPADAKRFQELLKGKVEVKILKKEI
jgi:L-ascorbate metabolism protein UlaG (beta-lactamase superfamily)